MLVIAQIDKIYSIDKPLKQGVLALAFSNSAVFVAKIDRVDST